MLLVCYYLQGQDGELNATYEVAYGKDDVCIVDHLVEDYIDGQVKFIVN